MKKLVLVLLLTFVVAIWLLSRDIGEGKRWNFGVEADNQFTACAKIDDCAFLGFEYCGCGGSVAVNKQFVDSQEAKNFYTPQFNCTFPGGKFQCGMSLYSNFRAVCWRGTCAKISRRIY